MPVQLNQTMPDNEDGNHATTECELRSRILRISRGAFLVVRNYQLAELECFQISDIYTNGEALERFHAYKFGLHLGICPCEQTVPSQPKCI